MGFESDDEEETCFAHGHLLCPLCYNLYHEVVIELGEVLAVIEDVHGKGHHVREAANDHHVQKAGTSLLHIRRHDRRICMS